MKLVFAGLSLSSSWGNGHATTYRALIGGLASLGHEVLFIERDVPWYANHRDLPAPDFCRLAYYRSLAGLAEFREAIADADAVIVGSYVPEGVPVIDTILSWRDGPTAFYDLDTPVTLAKLRRADEEYLAHRQIPRFGIYLSFAGGPTLGELQQTWGARRAAALYCSVDPVTYRNTGEALQWDLGYLGTYSEDRQGALERLLLEPARRLPHLRFVVAGPQYPDVIAWPANVDRFDHLAPSKHASFYSRQRFTLNVTRSDMAAVGWSPSVRLFEAAACGVPLISDGWVGLHDILPRQSIIVAARSDDVVRALTGVGEDDRVRLAARARDAVLDAHTGRARAMELVQLLGAAPASSAAPLERHLQEVRS